MSESTKPGGFLARYSYGPRYKPSFSMILRGIAYIAAGRPRSLARDALVAIAGMPLPPRVRGGDRIPEDGGFVVVANHYERPGLWMAWPGLYLAHLIAERTGRDTHWIAIQEWESFSLWRIPVPSRLIRVVFERAFHVYGMIAMPPPHARVSARASAMRLAANTVKAGDILGLMPEGTVGPTPELLEAREGAGAFLLLLAASGASVLPVGLYEAGGRLVADVGTPFMLSIPAGTPKRDRDRWARNTVMEAIKQQLPEPLWGALRETRGEPSPLAGDDGASVKERRVQK